MYSDIGLLVLRVVVGWVVLQHGLLKLGLAGQGGSIGGVGKWFGGIGLRPGIFWALVAVVAEVGGSLLTIVGLGGPIGPGILAGDLVVVTIVAHWSQGFWAGGGKVGWEFPLPLAAAAFAVATVGGGSLSLDAAFRLTYPEALLPVWLALMAAGVALALAVRALFAPKPVAQKA